MRVNKQFNITKNVLHLTVPDQTKLTYMYQMFDQPLCKQVTVILDHQTLRCLLIHCCARTKHTNHNMLNKQSKPTTIWLILNVTADHDCLLHLLGC